MRIFSSFIIAAALIAFAGPSAAQTAMVKLIGAQNNSGETGILSIVPNGTGGITVRVSVVGEPAGGNQPMHIHTGTCANLGGVYKPLKNVVDGESVTDVPGLSIDDLERRQYAINLHKGPGPLISTYVACADLSNTGANL
jgi:hypothetical protein